MSDSACMCRICSAPKPVCKLGVGESSRDQPEQLEQLLCMQQHSQPVHKSDWKHKCHRPIQPISRYSLDYLLESLRTHSILLLNMLEVRAMWGNTDSIHLCRHTVGFPAEAIV